MLVRAPSLPGVKMDESGTAPGETWASCRRARSPSKVPFAAKRWSAVAAPSDPHPYSGPDCERVAAKRWSGITGVIVAPLKVEAGPAGALPGLAVPAPALTALDPTDDAGAAEALPISAGAHSPATCLRPRRCTGVPPARPVDDAESAALTLGATCGVTPAPTSLGKITSPACGTDTWDTGAAACDVIGALAAVPADTIAPTPDGVGSATCRCTGAAPPARPARAVQVADKPSTSAALAPPPLLRAGRGANGDQAPPAPELSSSGRAL